VDWLFDGPDIIAACRTAYDDGLGGARNNHDANFLTFHRFASFRSKTMADSTPMPETAQVREETADLIITGRGWSLAKLADGEKAFANRAYVWKEVPARFHNWRFTQTSGGERAEVRVKIRREAAFHFATALSQAKVETAGWAPVPDVSFHYTDGGKTRMTVYSRTAKTGEELLIPQANWTGGLLLVPPSESR
jgi:hypothetical protein